MFLNLASLMFVLGPQLLQRCFSSTQEAARFPTFPLLLRNLIISTWVRWPPLMSPILGVFLVTFLAPFPSYCAILCFSSCLSCGGLKAALFSVSWGFTLRWGLEAGFFFFFLVSAKSVLRTVLLEPQRHIQAPDSDPELTMGQVLDGQSPSNLHKHLEAGIIITLIS